jgi:competence protein ComEC
MRRWIVFLAAAILWLTFFIFDSQQGSSRILPGTDRLSSALALPRLWFSAARHAFMTATERLPSVGGQLIAGLTTGDTSRVSDVLDADMKTVSLTHLTAVSGANCHIVVIVVFFVLARLGLPRGWRVVGALIALVGFVAFVTPQASVARAALMSVAVLVGLVSGRLATGLPALGVSVIVLLLIEPRWAADYGFALSVAATWGLLTLVQPLAQWLQSWRIGRFAFGSALPPSVRLAVSVPIAAAIACQPILIFLQPALSTYGVLANVLCEPVAALATMGGLVVAFVAGISPVAASLLAWIAWLPAEWIGRVASVTASFPMAQIAWVDGVFGACLALLVSLILVFLIVRPRFLSVHIHAALAVFVSVVLVVATGFTAGGNAWRAMRIPEDWSIAACDVGQGDAFVVHSPDAHSRPHFALIDTGPSETNARRCLARLGVETLDFVVLTHWDADHVGGLGAVMARSRHFYVIRPADESEGLILAHLVSGGATIDVAHAGMRGTLGLASWEVLWPDSRTPSMQTGNSGSIAMLWNINGISFATLADLGAAAQDTLAAHISSFDEPAPSFARSDRCGRR